MGCVLKIVSVFITYTELLLRGEPVGPPETRLRGFQGPPHIREAPPLLLVPSLELSAWRVRGPPLGRIPCGVIDGQCR